MCCNLFHGDPKKTCGTMSSGGSDSLFLACKAYMFYARKEKGITHPNIVMPVSYIVFKVKITLGFIKIIIFKYFDVTFKMAIDNS